MLAQPISPTAQTGEDQSSHAVFASREAHWKMALIGLLGAARTLAVAYLKNQHADASACIDADHHRAVVDLFDQIAHADALGLSLAGADQLAASGMSAVDLWSIFICPFTATSLERLVAQNEHLRVGDVVYKADTIYRHTLTEADFAVARSAA